MPRCPAKPGHRTPQGTFGFHYHSTTQCIKLSSNAKLKNLSYTNVTEACIKKNKKKTLHLSRERVGRVACHAV